MFIINFLTCDSLTSSGFLFFLFRRELTSFKEETNSLTVFVSLYSFCLSLIYLTSNSWIKDLIFFFKLIKIDITDSLLLSNKFKSGSVHFSILAQLILIRLSTLHYLHRGIIILGCNHIFLHGKLIFKQFTLWNLTSYGSISCYSN